MGTAPLISAVGRPYDQSGALAAMKHLYRLTVGIVDTECSGISSPIRFIISYRKAHPCCFGCCADDSMVKPSCRLLR